MASLRIPEQYRSGIAKMISLSEESVQELISILEGEPPMLNQEELPDRVTPKIRTIPAADLKETIKALLSLYIIKEDPLADFIEDLSQAMQESPFEELKLSEEEYERFKERLYKLLSINSLYLATRAVTLLQARDSYFMDAQVLTDIRPVFGLELNGRPPAAMIIHTLRVEVYQGDESKELFIGLDDGDLDTLVEVLGRAKQKSESLQSVLEAAEVTYIASE
jgi:hypothetical protein